MLFFNKPIFIGSLLLGAASFNAQATLTSYIGADNVGLVHSSISNVTWTQDANLLGTLESTIGYTNAINAIIAATPINSGSHTVSASDFSEGGKANWYGAIAFVNCLNIINYGGSNHWRLPTINELGQLFYTELNGTVRGSTPNTPFFNNVQDYAYWSGMEYAQNPDEAWTFVTQRGFPYHYGKLNQNYAWAVINPGQVAAVPVAASVWLMGSGLLGLLGLKRTRSVG